MVFGREAWLSVDYYTDNGSTLYLASAPWSITWAMFNIFSWCLNHSLGLSSIFIEKETQCTSQLSLALTKYQRKTTWRRKRFVWAHGFRGFGPWSACSIISSSVLRQHVIGEDHGEVKLLTWSSENQRGLERGRGQGQDNTPFQGMTQGLTSST